MKNIAPAFCGSPSLRVRLNQIRLRVDTVGLLAARLCTPIVHGAPWPLLLHIYNIAAWLTVLTVDSSRLPEFATTRILQKQSYRYAAKIAPLLLASWGGTVYLFHISIHTPTFTIPSSIALLASAYLDELLFRNILQVRLRQIGFAPWLAVTLQSVVFALCFAVQHTSLGVLACSFYLGIANGWIVYKSRSLWTAFVLSVVWRYLFFSPS